MEFANERAAAATVILNIVGSLLIGVLAGRRLEDTRAWPLLALGFAGGLTTFSTFALHVARRLNGDEIAVAVEVLVSTVLLAVVAAGVGYRFASRSLGETPPTDDVRNRVLEP